TTGGAGDNQITVLGIGGSQAFVSGGRGQNVVTVVIPAFPTGEFMNLHVLDAKTLVVDNSANTASGVTWRLTNGELLEASAVPAASFFSALGTSGAELVRILGGTQNDTLSVVSTVSDGVTGLLNGNRVELRE